MHGAGAGGWSAPAWVTVKVWPPTLTVPERELVSALAPTLTLTAAVPDPLVFDRLIQPAVVVAVQAQLLVVVTVKLVDPPDAPTLAEPGDTVNVHEVAPAWLTVKVWPPAVTVPVRAEVEPLAATVTVRVALPEPLPG